MPDLAGLPIRVNPRLEQSDPQWWSSSAVVGERFVAKFAWSELRARRLWREGVLLRRLAAQAPELPVPEVAAVHEHPALVVTRLVPGVPMSFGWAGAMAGPERDEVAGHLAGFLALLHGMDAAELLGDLDVVHPTPQSDTAGLRARFPRLVDDRPGASVLRWCDWVDGVLADPGPAVYVHGDLHGYNQVWDRATSRLLAVVDFEESGVADAHYDLRYLPAYDPDALLVRAVAAAYRKVTGRCLAMERVMAWHTLTALGDALWRTEAGVALPGGGSPTTYVDGLARRLDLLGIRP